MSGVPLPELETESQAGDAVAVPAILREENRVVLEANAADEGVCHPDACPLARKVSLDLSGTPGAGGFSRGWRGRASPKRERAVSSDSRDLSA